MPAGLPATSFSSNWPSQWEHHIAASIFYINLLGMKNYVVYLFVLHHGALYLDGYVFLPLITCHETTGSY
jgi:hypothetical protein